VERSIVYTCPPHAGFFFRAAFNSKADREARRFHVLAVVDRAQRGLENLYSGVAAANDAPFPSQRPIKTAAPPATSLMRQDR
jgi:hypothetical protein